MSRIEHFFETVKDGAVKIQMEADKAKQMGLLSWVKQFTAKRARRSGVKSAMLINAAFVVSGIALLVSSNTALKIVGGGSVLAGGYGLFNNMRYAL